jgi:tRNA modification GTPase
MVCGAGVSYRFRRATHKAECAAMMEKRAQADVGDTIFALATPPGKGGIAVIRVSGPRADEALEALTGRRLCTERRMELRTLHWPGAQTEIDKALCVRFSGGHSYTGEIVVEFHIHGGRAVSAAVLEALAGLPGLRPAEPGEFTRRAVENGRLDLTQAEAIADLINAETEAQRRIALRQLEGELGRLYEDWRARLIRAAAWAEAALDFPDEDIPPGALVGSRAETKALLSEIRHHLDDARRGEILRDGLHVAVIGPPNAGKSSLVNALARRDVAIVSAIPGTTRDVIETRLDLGGFAVILADTAGLREAGDPIEMEGVRRARARAEAADFKLLVLDGSAAQPGSGLSAEDRQLADLTVWSKADCVATRAGDRLWASAKTGEGLPDVIAALTARAAAAGGIGEAPVLTRARHRAALELAAQSLEKAVETDAWELAAEDLRIALRALGRITGRVDLDELLDVVFRDFCIGK